jgi:hypothetical protein
MYIKTQPQQLVYQSILFWDKPMAAKLLFRICSKLQILRTRNKITLKSRCSGVTPYF